MVDVDGAEPVPCPGFDRDLQPQRRQPGQGDQAVGADPVGMARAVVVAELAQAVILAPTRWKLREAIRLVNQTLAELHVEQHPDKTFIGRISRGFDFLGYAFRPAGLDAAPPTIERCAQRVSQLYEQGVDLLHIGTYVRRWLRWARSGIRSLGAGLSERALVLVVRSLGRLGWLGGCLPPLCTAVAGPAVGEEGDGTECPQP